MSQSHEEYPSEDVPSLVSETVPEEQAEHITVNGSEDEVHAEAEAEAEAEPSVDVVSDHHAEEDEDAARDASPPNVADRYAEAHGDSDSDANSHPPAAPGEAEADEDVLDPPAKRSGTVPLSTNNKTASGAAHDHDASSHSDGSDDDRGDAENERLFNLYQERLNSKPLGSAREAKTRAGGPPVSPHAEGYARRGSAGLVRGNSYQGTGRQSVAASESAVAYRRRASVLSSARYNAARASIGGSGQYTADRRRSSVAMTEGEQLALERMEENESRREAAKERAELIKAYRDEDVVEMELQKEIAAEERLADRMHAQERQRAERIRANWERQERARARRESQEQERKQTIESSIETKTAPTDPFQVMMARRRYSAAIVRSDMPVTPHRRITAGRRESQGAPDKSDQSAETGAPEAQPAPARSSARGVGSGAGTPRSRRSSVQEAKDMWRAPAAPEGKTKAWR